MCLTHTFRAGSLALLSTTPPTSLPPSPPSPIAGPLFTTSLNPSTSLKATSQMTLVCVANNSPGSPNLVASWSYPQPPGDTRVLVSMTTYVNGTLRTSLSVTNVSSGDNGVYMCSFTNGALKGSINSSTLVSVLCEFSLAALRAVLLLLES